MVLTYKYNMDNHIVVERNGKYFARFDQDTANVEILLRSLAAAEKLAEFMEDMGSWRNKQSDDIIITPEDYLKIESLLAEFQKAKEE